MIDLTTIVEFANGVRLINCTPHTVLFLDGENVVTVAPSGATLLATPKETEAGQRGNARLVKTIFVTSEKGEAELVEIEEQAPDVLILGSIISAQAYAGRVVAMVPAAGFERAAPPEKRYNTEKFTIF